MAILYPFSNLTAERLKTIPSPGGTHRWLAHIASGLNRTLSAEKCAAFLRRCCDAFVHHRPVPDSEIEGAIQLAYGSHAKVQHNFGRRPVEWPEPDLSIITKVLSDVTPRFDPVLDTGLKAHDVLSKLFLPGELVCSGRVAEQAIVRPLEETLHDAQWSQFIVLNPMRQRTGVNNQGKPSARCQNNTAMRRYLVAEFDSPNLSKEQQAQLITKLSTFAPLVMVVDSGGKSLHGWFQVDRYNAKDQVRFFCLACLLGADPTRWDICGWLRMPGGMRAVEGRPSVRQRILFFQQEVPRG
jgi:hypothetical protein